MSCGARFALDNSQVSAYLHRVQAQRRSSEARQSEFIDAALHIIATRGIAALTTRSLAEQVGLSSGAIFRHFASLDALLVAVVTRVATVLDGTFPSTQLAPREQLLNFVEARSQAVGSQVGILRLVVSEQFSLALPAPAAALLAGCVTKTRSFVLTCLRAGQAGGDFRSDIEAAALAVVVMGTIQMLALTASGAGGGGSALARAARDGLLTLITLVPPPSVLALKSTQRKKKKV